MAGKSLSDISFSMLRKLPRIALNNITHIRGQVKKNKRGRGQHGGDTHGYGNHGRKLHQQYVPVGWESGKHPYCLRFPKEPYYKGHHLRRQHPPISLLQLQKLIDLNRLDITKPIDLTTLCNTGLFFIRPEELEYGLHLTDEGADIFQAKVNLEVQYASESSIAAIERNGGTICTAFYDARSLTIMTNPKKFFEQGVAIPRRMIPPQDTILYYTSPANRGYLADPEEISWERLVLSQKYGYKLPDIERDPLYNMLSQRKDPRQIFYGLQPGWVINLKEKIIFKPKDEGLLEFYDS